MTLRQLLDTVIASANIEADQTERNQLGLAVDRIGTEIADVLEPVATSLTRVERGFATAGRIVCLAPPLGVMSDSAVAIAASAVRAINAVVSDPLVRVTADDLCAAVFAEDVEHGSRLSADWRDAQALGPALTRWIGRVSGELAYAVRRLEARDVDGAVDGLVGVILECVDACGFFAERSQLRPAAPAARSESA